MTNPPRLGPHDPEEGWDEITEEDVADILGPDADASGRLAQPLPGEVDQEPLNEPLPRPEVGSARWREDQDRLAGAVARLRTRWPETQLEPSLDRIALLMDILGDPQRAYPVLQVAGTNGKSSVVRMIDSLLRALHQRTGAATSPELQSVTERILLDGEPMPAAAFADLVDELEPYFDLVDRKSEESGGPRLSFFEALVGMAYSAFADTPVDVAVVETGMGGEWDATNVATADVAVLTSIGLDHTEYLGETLAEIAGEKAGIIKARDADVAGPRDAVAVIGRQQPEALDVLLARCAETGAVAARLGIEFDVDERSLAVGGQHLKLRGLGGVYEDVFLPAFGHHQADNAACALAAVEAYFGAGPDRQLDVELVRAGFAAVEFPGRLERLSSSPTVLIDAAHNGHGGRALAAAIDSDFDFRHLVAVVSMLEGKDAGEFLSALVPVCNTVVVTSNGSPRAMDTGHLAELARERFTDDRVHEVDTLPDALEAALTLAAEAGAAEAGTDDDDQTAGVGVIATGSVVTAGAVRTLFGKEAP